jgi:hypothetical protein
MYRPTLILRRFGAMSFGLGYLEDGAWVDHTTLPDRGSDLEIAGTKTEEDRRALHAMLECCDSTATLARERQDALMVAGDRTPAGIGYRAGDTDVDAVVGSTVAG